jgi:hypothetical protein
VSKALQVAKLFKKSSAIYYTKSTQWSYVVTSSAPPDPFPKCTTCKINLKACNDRSAPAIDTTSPLDSYVLFMRGARNNIFRPNRQQ